MFLRGIQLILIILAGILCVILGYKLFLYGVDKGRNKLGSKSEAYKLLFSGSAPGLFFMVIGVLIVIFSLYSVSLSSEIMNLKTELSAISEKLSKSLAVDINLPDTTRTTEVIAEASFVPIPTKPSPTLRTARVKPAIKRQINRTLNAANFAIKDSKSIYRSQAELSRVINKHNKAIEYCYKKETRNNPNLKGDLDVEFTIDYNGRVTAVRIVRSSMYSKNIEKCISGRIRGWRFKAIGFQKDDVKVRQKYIFG